MVDYLPSTYKPNKFTLEHLMAKLKVHIRINNNPNHKKPLNTKVSLHTRADIDYPNKGLKNLSGRSSYNVSLGSFTEDGDTDNWVSDELLILPQTLERGRKCLRFTVSSGDEYNFTPNEDLVLQAGKIINTFGIRGEVKVLCWLDDPEMLCEFDRCRIDGKEYTNSPEGRARKLSCIRTFYDYFLKHKNHFG